jgi:hypothetical protein
MTDALAEPRPQPPLGWRIVLLALGITLLLFTAWTIKGWADLRALRLPDNDDMMRLAQVRDWLGGQGFDDLMQYRLGPPGGASMHWSRLGDAGPALLILLLTPLVGAHEAAVAAVIGYMAILFFLYLLLVARIATRFDGAAVAPIAVILAALAFPTISLFVPGRIDHHALQILLILVLVDALVGPPGLRAGLIAGLATALSLAIGLEAAPEIIAAMAAIGVLWVFGDAAEDRRALGIALSLGGVTLLLFAVARPQVWPGEWCDGFTPASFRASLALAAAWGLLWLAGRWAAGRSARLVVAIIVGAGVGLLVWILVPVCFGGPYGALDPFLKRVWMDNVGEAQGLFQKQDSWNTAFAYGALSFVGLAFAVVRLVRMPAFDRRWAAFTLFLLLSTIAAVLQIRVTNILAGIAIVPCAGAILRAQRQHRALPLRLALWIAGAGITYNLLAQQAAAWLAEPMAMAGARAEVRRCLSADAILAAGRQPAGTVVATIDLGAYFIGMTGHRALAAPYHRNNEGNLAAYRFFLAKPAAARAMAHAWRVDYVALCRNNMHERELDALRPGSLVALLQDGRAPAWLEPIPTVRDTSLLFYRVRAAP